MVTFRFADEHGRALILSSIRELAECESLADRVTVTEDLFGTPLFLSS
ncbi:MAG: hypothetical protein IKE62_00840 [Oscillospiraceae bacterium]|nr:hypothetical protein [Oscillospiraceae bacterium]